MLDIMRLMYDEPEKYSVPSNLVATFRFRGKLWRAIRVEDPKSFRGQGWFLSDSEDPEAWDPEKNSLAEFLEDPERFARNHWNNDQPGWSSRTGKFASRRFNREWINPTFLRFEEVE